MDSQLKSPVAITSLWIAAERAIESASGPSRLFEDSYAQRLAGREGHEFARKILELSPVTAKNVVIRTKFLDDVVVQEASKDKGIKQFVNLACGCDTRQFRLPLPSDATFYELDFSEVINWKQKCLAGETPKCKLVSIGVDLRDTDLWKKKLLSCGYNSNQRSLWIVEGLLYYLSSSAALSLLKSISSMVAPGSILAGDLVTDSSLRRPHPVPKFLEQVGSPMIFGLDEPEKALLECGWKCPPVLQFNDPEYGARLLPEKYHLSKKYPREKFGIRSGYMFSAVATQATTTPQSRL